MGEKNAIIFRPEEETTLSLFGRKDEGHFWAKGVPHIIIARIFLNSVLRLRERGKMCVIVTYYSTAE